MPKSRVKESPFYLQIKDHALVLREKFEAIVLVDIHGMRNEHDDVECDVVIGKLLLLAMKGPHHPHCVLVFRYIFRLSYFI